MSFENVVIKLRSIAVGGDAVGEVCSVENADQSSDLLGITAFVPYGVPGEEVVARVLERKNKFIRAEILKVNNEILDRETPSCKYFGTCGGCELQHIDYRAQVEFKYEMVVGALRSGKIPVDVIDKTPQLIRSSPLGYRRRIHLHVDRQGHVGFYKPGTRSVVKIDECLIADTRLQPYISALSSIGLKICGRINSVHLEVGEDDVVAYLIAPYELSVSEVKSISQEARSIFKNFIISSAGKEVLSEGITSIKLSLNKSNSVYVRIPGGGFSQVNWPINLELINSVSEYFRSKNITQVFDLFCGAGNFSMPLAKDGIDVVAVETDPRLVSLGRETAKEQGFLKKIKFEEQSVNKYLKFSKPSFNENSGIIADPPRSGLGPLTNDLTFSNHIVLISCHLPSFVRDLRALLDMGYSVNKMELYDMFPQTSYLESVVYLEKGQLE